MEEWLRSVFPVEETPEGDKIVFTFENQECQALISVFLTLFGSAPVPSTAAGLKAADPENQAGWHEYFDAWKSQGLTN